MTDDIRLNQAKRKAIKDAWKDTIWKRTPMEFDAKLSDAVDNFKQHESDVWNDVVKPTVEKNFPPEDMKVLQRYSRGSDYNSFSEYDSCFYFKPSFSDDKERQFRFAYDKEDMTALHYEELMNLGVNPNLELEYSNDKAKNPHYYNEEKINSNLRNFYDHTDKKFSVTLIADLQSNELYDYLQIHFKTNDKRYIIHAVDGLVDINIDECYKRQKKIEKELSVVLKNTEKKGPINFKIKSDKTGKSTVTAFYYFFKSGDYGEVSCYDFAEHMDMNDGLNVAISSKEIGEWLRKDW